MSNPYTGSAQIHLQPYPGEFFANLADRAQQREDDDLEKAYKLQGLMQNVKTATFDRPYKQMVDDKYYPILNEVADKITKGDKSYRGDLLKAQTAFFTDPTVQMLNYNYAKENEYLKDRGELEKTGKFRPWYDERAKFTGGRQGLTPFDYSGSKPYIDPYDDAAKVIGNIAETQLSTGGESLEKDQNGNLTGFTIKDPAAPNFSSSITSLTKLRFNLL